MPGPASGRLSLRPAGTPFAEPRRAAQPRPPGWLLTGVHEPGTSRFEALRAFAPGSLLEEALGRAEAWGYVGHEFGDLSLILAG